MDTNLLTFSGSAAVALIAAFLRHTKSYARLLVSVRTVPAPPRRVASEGGRVAIHCDRSGWASGRLTRSA